MKFSLACVLALPTALVLCGATEKAVQQHGTVQHIKVHGKSLEGNLEGDSPDRDVTVYLPPTYATGSRRYPVVYLLHGYTGTDSTWTGRIANVPEIADKVLAAGGAREMIIIMPSAFTIYKGSMYSNSPTTGDWETFITRDLVSYVDSHYRTIPNRMSRGLAGHSMGGYGVVRLGMKYPEVFSSLYSLSACCLGANLNPNAQRLAAVEAIKTAEEAAKADRGVMTTLAEAAAWSPDPKNPPFFFDLPVKDGKIQPNIVAKWVANAPLAMVDQYVPSLKKYRAIAMDVGLQDPLLNSNKQLDESLTRLGVIHTFETYEGNHTNHISDRIETKVLQFFSNNLTFAKGVK